LENPIFDASELEPFLLADTADKNTVTGILSVLGHRAKRYLGQHFLVSERVRDQIVSLVSRHASSVCVEIGGGLGALSIGLAKACDKLLVVEKDKLLAEWLKMYLSRFSNTEVLHNDFFALDLEQKASGKVLLVGNIPYYISGQLVRFMCSNHYLLCGAVLTVQKEVAGKITGKAGKLGIPAIAVAAIGNARYVKTLSEDVFYPVPQVESAIIEIEIASKPRIEAPSDFVDFVAKVMRYRRKQISNALSFAGITQSNRVKQMLSNLGIEPGVRAEELNIDQWIALARAFNLC